MCPATALHSDSPCVGRGTNRGQSSVHASNARALGASSDDSFSKRYSDRSHTHAVYGRALCSGQGIEATEMCTVDSFRLTSSPGSAACLQMLCRPGTKKVGWSGCLVDKDPPGLYTTMGSGAGCGRDIRGPPEMHHCIRVRARCGWSVLGQVPRACAGSGAEVPWNSSKYAPSWVRECEACCWHAGDGTRAGTLWKHPGVVFPMRKAVGSTHVGVRNSLAL